MYLFINLANSKIVDNYFLSKFYYTSTGVGPIVNYIESPFPWKI